MIDIDYFKKYNDSYGHLAGDNYLMAFGILLNDISAKYPVSFYRYGGEEFVALFGISDKDIVEKYAIIY